MLTIMKANKIFSNFDGSSFIGITMITDVRLSGGKNNPHQNRIKKVSVGVAQVFNNKNVNAYENMINNRLRAEGKEPNFKVDARVWGERIENSPFVVHEKDGETNYYLELIFHSPTKNYYLLDNEIIDQKEIIGLEKKNEGYQGGLNEENKIHIRTVKFENIRQLNVNKKQYVF